MFTRLFPSVHVGGGFDRSLSEHLGFKIEVRDHVFVGDATDNLLEFVMGLTIGPQR